MRPKYFFLFLLLTSSFAIGQSKFLKGYYINSKGLKTECFIKNYDWKNNPKSFDIRNSEGSEVKNISIDEIVEIAIDNEVKFIKATVEIDNSNDDLQTLGIIKQVNFTTKTILLKVLVEGTNNLYLYEDEYIAPKMFFSTKTKKEIKQLIYKRYIEDNIIKSNETYKQQLINDVNCNSNSANKIEKLIYMEYDLTKYFLNANNCMGDVQSKNISTTREFKINIYPMVSMISANMNLELNGSNIAGRYTTENKFLNGFGLEIESLLPFNHNQWGIFIKPTYVSNYTTSFQEYRYVSVVPENDVNINFKYFEVPIGVRKYFYINNNSRIFLNASYNYIKILNDSYVNVSSDLKRELIGSTGNMSFGVGFQYKRFNFEVNKFLGIDYQVRSDNILYNNISFSFKYNICKRPKKKK